MTTQRTVVVTGGSSGIGLGLARRYAGTGARVVVTGRHRARLDAAHHDLPDVVTVAGDLADPAARVALADRIGELGGWDVLVNNAGIQRRVPIAEDHADWTERQGELDLLLAAPLHLATLLLPPALARRRPAQIVNVTSGGAFAPQPFAPAYSAAKAALHSWTLNLRYALAGTAVRVTELIPPAVATGLGDPSAPHGADVDAFCDTVFPHIEAGDEQVGFGPTATPEFTARLVDERRRFDAGATRFPVSRF